MAITVDPDWWKSLFDEVYLLTDARSVCDDEITRREVDLLCDIVPLKGGERILDLCGGQGRHSLELSRRGFGGCTVLDYSEALIEHGRSAAAQEGRNVEFVRADACETGLTKGSFDHVLILGNSLGYLPGEDADLGIVREAHRLLKEGGRLLVDVTDGAAVRERFSPNAWHEVQDDVVVCRQREIDDNLVRAREMVISKEQGLIRDRTYAMRVYEPESLSNLVEEAGFRGTSLHRDFSVRRDGADCGFMNHRIMITARKE